jgi:hypothetical protein
VAMRALLFVLLLYPVLGLSELLPDYYAEPGNNPHREYIGQTGDEHIDPFTGMLQRHYVDLVLPGEAISAVRKWSMATSTGPAVAGVVV